MKHILKLIDSRLLNLNAIIAQHQACIDKDIQTEYYKANIVKFETERTELTKELDVLRNLIIENEIW